MYLFNDYSQTFNEIEYKNLVLSISGLSYFPDFYSYKNYFLEHIIKPEEAYRPDKIAYNLWGNQRASWILDAINNFTHGIKEYEKNKSIYYLSKDILVNLGIL